MSNAQIEQGSAHGSAGTHGGRSKCRDHASRGRSRRAVCPYCLEEDEVIPILYGFPSDKAFLRAERGEVYLGGMIAGPTSYYCKRDDREF